MKLTKAILSAVLGILLLSVAGSFPTHASSVSYTANYHASASRYISIDTLPGTVAVTYQVANGVYSGQAENASTATKLIDYLGTSTGGNVSESLVVTSSYSNDNVSVGISGRGGSLLYAAVNQYGIDQIVWSGVDTINSTASTSLTGFAYLNSSATASLVLGFASTNGIETASMPLGVTSSVTVNVPQFSFSASSSTTVTGEVNVTFPLRYSEMTAGTASINATGSITTPIVAVGASSFLGANYPDMVWQGTATGTTSFNGTLLTGNIYSRTTEFFGANGTAVGYAQEFNIQSSKSLFILGATANIAIIASSTLLVSEPNPVGGGSEGSAFAISVEGQPVIIQMNSQGTVSSTANVEFQHSVLVSGGSDMTLVLLNITTSAHSYLIVDFSNNTTQSVSQATPQSEKQTQLTVGSRTYSATQVNISATGNTIFNVTDTYPSVVVFKVNATGTFQLDSQNYWTTNGRVYIFDDPSSTYYIANGTGSSSSHTTSTSQQLTTGQSGTTSAQSSGTGQAAPFSSIDYEGAAVVVIVLIALGITAVVVRRKQS